MARPVLAVIFGTFTLRLATGVTGAMLIYYLAVLPQYGGETVQAWEIGVLGALFYASELVLSPIFGVLSDRVGHRRIMLVGPAFGAVAVVITAFTVSLPVIGFTRLLEGASTAASVPSILGFIAFATAADELLRGKAVARFEAATLAGLMLGFVVARPAVRRPGPDGVPRQRGPVRRLVRDLPLGVPEHAEPAPAAARPRSRRGPPSLPPDPARLPRLAAGAHLDRHQRHARPVHEPDAVPAGPRAGPAVRGPAAHGRLRPAPGQCGPRGRRAPVLRGPVLLGRQVQEHAPDVDHRLRDHRRRGDADGRRGDQPRGRRSPAAAPRAGRDRRGGPVRPRRGHARGHRPAGGHDRGLPGRPGRDHGPLLGVPGPRPDRRQHRRRRRGPGGGARRDLRRVAGAARDRLPADQPAAPVRAPVCGGRWQPMPMPDAAARSRPARPRPRAARSWRRTTSRRRPGWRSWRRAGTPWTRRSRPTPSWAWSCPTAAGSAATRSGWSGTRRPASRSPSTAPGARRAGWTPPRCATGPGPDPAARPARHHGPGRGPLLGGRPPPLGTAVARRGAGGGDRARGGRVPGLGRAHRARSRRRTRPGPRAVDGRVPQRLAAGGAPVAARRAGPAAGAGRDPGHPGRRRLRRLLRRRPRRADRARAARRPAAPTPRPTCASTAARGARRSPRRTAASGSRRTRPTAAASSPSRSSTSWSGSSRRRAPAFTGRGWTDAAWPHLQLEAAKLAYADRDAAAHGPRVPGRPGGAAPLAGARGRAGRPDRPVPRRPRAAPGPHPRRRHDLAGRRGRRGQRGQPHPVERRGLRVRRRWTRRRACTSRTAARRSRWIRPTPTSSSRASGRPTRCCPGCCSARASGGRGSSPGPWAATSSPRSTPSSCPRWWTAGPTSRRRSRRPRITVEPDGWLAPPVRVLADGQLADGVAGGAARAGPPARAGLVRRRPRARARDRAGGRRTRGGRVAGRRDGPPQRGAAGRPVSLAGAGDPDGRETARTATPGGILRQPVAAALTPTCRRPRVDSGGARDLERRPELPLHQRDRGRSARPASPRWSRGARASPTSSRPRPRRSTTTTAGGSGSARRTGCPGLLHAAGYAIEKHAVFVVCDGTCAKTFLR